MRAAAFLFAVTLYAQPSPKRAEIDRIFAAFNTHTPGCSIGVSHKGEVQFTAGYGMADLERNVPITANTVFESGSVAKQFTAATLILAAQQGKVSLDDPMRKYLPELPDYGAPLTIRQVISHISGIREWRAIALFAGFPEGKFVYENQDLLQMASLQKGLNFDPGSRYSYSNTGYNISTILIERATGKTFQQFTREMIFEPLAMTQTRWRDDFRRVVPNRALAYRPHEGGFVQNTPIENIIGAGGLLTTVHDLLRWNENFKHAKVGGAEMVKLQQTPATLTSGKTIQYAAGLTVSTFEGVREVSHGGATGGYRTWLARYPDQDVSVAVLCNAANANPVALGRDTARLWTGSKPAAARTATYSSLNPQEFAGLYRDTRNNTTEWIKVKDGKLRMDNDAELLPAAEDRFYVGGTEVVFEPGKRKFRVLVDSGDIVYERVEPASPTASDLAPLLGRYTSPETGGAIVTFAAGSKPGELTMRIAAEPSVILKPTFRDTFETAQGTAIRFLRDSDGKVTGMSAGEGRVWDLRFSRIR